MRWLALCVAAGAATTVGLVAPPESSSSLPRLSAPLITLTARAPLAVQGRRFHSGERVRVTVTGAATAARSTRASRLGTFVVRFDGVTATRCDLIRVVAVGGNGSRAGLKMLPAPACVAE